jgi:outer membrane lipoprotein SlyB
MRSPVVSLAVASIAVFVALASGCATRQPVTSSPQGGYSYGTQYGVVQSIDSVRAQSQTSGAGAIVGGAIGGLVGHQVDHGAKKDLATGVGIVAGALIGNEVEKNNRGYHDVYRVTVRLESGAQRSFDYASLSDLRIGDRVRIDNNQLYRW